MPEAFICDYIRTPIGRFGGSLSAVRADDLSAVPLAALQARNKNVDWEAVEDVIYGCANQAGEDMDSQQKYQAELCSLDHGLVTSAQKSVQLLRPVQRKRQDIEMQRQKQRQPDTGNPVQGKGQPKTMFLMSAELHRVTAITA